MPQRSSVLDNWRRLVYSWLKNANTGKIGNTGTVTLAAGKSSTTVTDSRAGASSYIGFMPRTPNAAMEAGNLVISGQGDGFFTIEHTNNTLTDRTFTYCIMG